MTYIELDEGDRRMVAAVRATRTEIARADWAAAPAAARSAAIGRLLSTVDVLLAILADDPRTAEQQAGGDRRG